MTDLATDLETVVDTYLDAYGEPDDERRARLVAAAFATDGSLIDPPIDATGRDGIVAMAAAVQAQFPGHRFRRTTVVDAHHDFARYGWTLTAPDGTVALTGTDIVEVDAASQLRRVVGFLGDLAGRDS
jgi:SnoaL-like domain